jgi:hypothetical protein
MGKKRICRGYLPGDMIDAGIEKTAGFLTLVQKQTNCSKL